MAKSLSKECEAEWADKPVDATRVNAVAGGVLAFDRMWLMTIYPDLRNAGGLEWTLKPEAGRNLIPIGRFRRVGQR